jgi:plasmid stabilization system protein ParE
VAPRIPLRLTPEADNDYFEILASTFETWGIDQLLRYETQLNEALETIATHPEIGSPRSDIIDGIRMFALLPNVIYYTTSDSETLIVRILHHRRNARRALRNPRPHR